jgi:uncharacterized membrane protein YeaQ/YmgE (transglycosylase-associated protein family)
MMGRLIQINHRSRAGHIVPERNAHFSRRRTMADAGVGWIAAIIIGGIAGWLAEQFMKSNMGMFMNILLGIVGAAIASAILSYFGIVLGGWIGYLVCGFIGAVLLIWVVRVIRPA